MSPATAEAEETETTDSTVQGFWVNQQVYDLGFRDAVIAQIQALAELPPCWDGYSAPVIDPAVARAAETLVSKLRPHLVRRPRIVPLVSGGLQFEWHSGEGAEPRTLELEFESPTRIHYLQWHPRARVEVEDFVEVADVGTIERIIGWFARADV